MLQVRVQEILTGPQIAHGGSRCICVGTQLVDHLREPEEIHFIYYIYINLNILFCEFRRQFSMCCNSTLKCIYNATKNIEINRSYWANLNKSMLCIYTFYRQNKPISQLS